MPGLACLALAIVWLRAFRDFRAARPRASADPQDNLLPDPASALRSRIRTRQPGPPRPRPDPVRAKETPPWQKLVVWVGAAGTGWAAARGFEQVWEARGRISLPGTVPAETVSTVLLALAVGLAFSAGLWLWPLTRGRRRAVALVLTLPATLKFLTLAPWIGLAWTVHSFPVEGYRVTGMLFWMDLLLPLPGYLALGVIWVRAVLDFFPWRRRLARARGPDGPPWSRLLNLNGPSGIPLWQMLLVWAGALGMVWKTMLHFFGIWSYQGGMMPPEPIPPPPDPTFNNWLVTALLLPLGFWLWPLTRGRLQGLALVLAAPATLVFLIDAPGNSFDWLFSILAISPGELVDPFAWLRVLLPPLAYAAIVLVWVRAFGDFHTARRGGLTVAGTP